MITQIAYRWFFFGYINQNKVLNIIANEERVISICIVMVAVIWKIDFPYYITFCISKCNIWNLVLLLRLCFLCYCLWFWSAVVYRRSVLLADSLSAVSEDPCTQWCAILTHVWFCRTCTEPSEKPIFIDGV